MYSYWSESFWTGSLHLEVSLWSVLASLVQLSAQGYCCCTWVPAAPVHLYWHSPSFIWLLLICGGVPGPKRIQVFFQVRPGRIMVVCPDSSLSTFIQVGQQVVADLHCLIIVEDGASQWSHGTLKPLDSPSCLHASANREGCKTLKYLISLLVNLDMHRKHEYVHTMQ